MKAVNLLVKYKSNKWGFRDALAKISIAMSMIHPDGISPCEELK